MGSVNLSNLTEAIERNENVEWRSNELAVSAHPYPYVAPKFRFAKDTTGRTAREKLSVEIIFVQAPAAVGKTITASYISSSRLAPMLDLATTGVGLNTIQGALDDVFYGDKRDPTRARRDFHEGKLPIIVDALDEGLMIAGQISFEAFLDSTARFICSTNEPERNRRKPKILFFGRPESADFSQFSMQYFGDENIATCYIELDFFSETDATRLIKEYATQALAEDKNILDLDGQPVNDLLALYFTQIKTALQIEEERDLWEDSTGRAFAGYAPVLAAIGRLLAKVTNPESAKQHLSGGGTQNAWTVIENVIQYILERERSKVVDPLKEAFPGVLNEGVMERAYDPHEQLTHLAQYLEEKKVQTTDRVRFPDPKHSRRYVEYVEKFCPEHPFIREGSAVNEVFESMIMSHVTLNTSLMTDHGRECLGRLSRNPFLWRCFSHRKTNTESTSDLEGLYAGFLLRSYCNDPLSRHESSVSIENFGNEVRVSCRNDEQAVEFELTTGSPVELFGSIRNCEIDLGQEVTIVGDVKNTRGNSRVFQFFGKNSIHCSSLSIDADLIIVDDSLWIDVDNSYHHNREPSLVVENGQLSVAGTISNIAPWRDWGIQRYEHGQEKKDQAVVRLVEQLRLKDPRTVVYTNDRYELDPDDAAVNWLRRSGICEKFLATLVGVGLARRDATGTGGNYNFRVSFNCNWDDFIGYRSDLRHKNQAMAGISEFWRRWRPSS